MTARSFPRSSLALAGVKCGFEPACISSWMWLPAVPAMCLGTESWDETGEVRGTGSPGLAALAQAAPAGTERPGQLKAEERGHNERVLMVPDGRFWWGCWGQRGYPGVTRAGSTLPT